MEEIQKKKREFKGLKIWDFMLKIPAGTMFVPLIISSLITTICIHAGLGATKEGELGISLWDYLGQPMDLLFGAKGQMFVIGMMLFCTGTMLTGKDFKDLSHRGLWNLLARLVPAFILSGLIMFFVGLQGFCGIDSVLLTIATTSANAALFVAISKPYCDNSDMATFPIMLISAMPILPFVFLSFFGHPEGEVPTVWNTLKPVVSMLIPFLLGILLGNLDHKIRDVFKSGNTLLIPFLGFEFGAKIDFLKAFSPSLLPSSLLLTVIFWAISIIIPYIVDHFVLKRPGYLAIGSASLAGTSLSIPQMFVGYSFEGLIYTQDQVDNALAMLAFVLLVTNLTSPFFTKFVMNSYFKKHKEEAHKIFEKTHPELLSAVYDSNGNYQEHHHFHIIYPNIFKFHSKLKKKDTINNEIKEDVKTLIKKEIKESNDPLIMEKDLDKKE